MAPSKKLLGTISLVLIFVFAWGGTSLPAFAGSFPEKAVELIITVNPGSAADVFARMLAKASEKPLGQPIVCKNKPGGGHAIAISYVLSQPADGYTMFGQTDTLAFGLATGKLPFQAKDLQPIAMVTSDPNLLVVNAKSDIKTLKEFMDYARKNPGKIKMGGVGANSVFHYLSDVLCKKASMKVKWIPYEGGSKVKMAILGSNIDACVISSGNVRTHIRAGKLRTLGIFTEKRDPYLTEIPTFKEMGYDITNIHWRGILTKKGVPDDRLAVIQKAFEEGLKDPVWTNYIKKHEQTQNFVGGKEFSKIFMQGVEEAKEWVASKKK